MMPLRVFVQFLKTLRDEANAKVCGSFARGDYDLKGHLSDIDLVVNDKGMKKAIEIFERFNVVGDSIIFGQWSSPRDLTSLPHPVEVMSKVWIKKEKDCPKTVSVYGIVFDTWSKRSKKQA